MQLRVFDVSGRLVRDLVSEELPGGHHAITWDRRADGGTEAAPGVYHVELRSDTGRRTQKLVVLR